MKTHRLLIFVFGQFIFWGCGQRPTKLESQTTDSSSINQTMSISQTTDSLSVTQRATKESPKQKIILDSFTDIPKEIEGCSCFYSESEEKNLKNEYLFVAGFDSAAFISIDNKLLKLQLVSTGRKGNSFGDYDHVDVYKTNNYNVTLDIKYLKQQGDEGWLNTGTITVESKDGLKEIIKFFGGCGC
jgi:hypothetical protein